MTDHDPLYATADHPATNRLRVGRPLRRCPECGSAKLEAVFDGEIVNQFCHNCIRCWHVDVDRAARVSHETCPGCLYRDRCRRAAT